MSVKLDIRDIPSKESGDFLFWHAEFGVFVQKSVLRAYYLELDKYRNLKSSGGQLARSSEALVLQARARVLKSGQVHNVNHYGVDQTTEPITP